MVFFFNFNLKNFNTKIQTKKHPVTFVENITNFRQFFQTEIESNREVDKFMHH